MPCAKCKANFTLINWKVKCIECMLYHCLRCLNKSNEGLCCEKCGILNKRPPDREKLMELRSKDLRDYLNKRHISTHGLVEKAELVELFCRCSNPASGTRSRSRLGSVVSGSVPNLASPQDSSRNNIFSNFSVRNVINNLGRRVEQTGNCSSNSSPRASTFQVHSFTNSVNAEFGNPQTSYGPTQFYSYTTVSNNEQQEEQLPPTNVQQSNSTQNTTAQQPAPTPAPPPPEPPRYPKLSDFKTIEELNDLSVKQLKELLTLNRVNYKGCVEKSELLDRATRLWTDNNLHKDEDYEAATVENLCKICMDGPLDCVILECGHLATCINCGKKLAECPICRQYVTRVVRTFKV